MKKPSPLKGRPSPLKGRPSPLRGKLSPHRGKGRGAKWIKDHIDHDGDACLTWPYSCDDHGYGTVGYCGKLYRASRLMCIFVNGEPPSNEHQAAHSCGNGHLACTHPKHVFWRTPFENRMESNKHGTGKPPAPRRLTIEDVENIRARTDGYFAISLEYGVHRDTIGKIMRGETWVNPRTTVTREQIARLKELAGTTSVRKIAEEVGVKQSTAYRFYKGETFPNFR